MNEIMWSGFWFVVGAVVGGVVYAWHDIADNAKRAQEEALQRQIRNLELDIKLQHDRLDQLDRRTKTIITESVERKLHES